MSIYDFTVKAQDGSNVSMSEYKGKVLVIVNTATGCGFTPQYDPLQDLYEEHQKDGLEILDFPCNQFAKIDVNGENADPLFKYLTENTSFAGFGKGMKAKMMNMVAKKMDKDFKNNGNVKWNFTKFVIDREGNIAARFEPTDSMDELKAKVESLL